MVTIPTIAEVIPKEDLDAIKKEIAAETVSLLEAQLLPLLRKTVNYTGPASVVASVELAFVEEGDKFVIQNNIVVALDFPPLPPYDVMEQVQRMLFVELFTQAVKKYL